MDCYLEFIWTSILPNKVHCSSSSEQYKKKAIMDDIWVIQMANNYPLAIFSEKKKTGSIFINSLNQAFVDQEKVWNEMKILTLSLTIILKISTKWDLLNNFVW